jgi:OFA family oxalate/formate antiporter-like MFS transporter
MFGPKHMATNYGMVLVGFGIGAFIASTIAGYYKNLASQDINLMLPAFIIAAICSAVSIVLMLTLKTKKKEKQKA